MKKIFGTLMCIVATVLMLSSCSENSKMKAMLECVPDSVDYVLAGNLKDMVESCGEVKKNNKIYLCPLLTDGQPLSMKDALNSLNVILKKSHVDLESFAVFREKSVDRDVMVLSIKSKDLFVDGIKESGYKKMKSEGKLDIYAKLSLVSTEGGKGRRQAVSGVYDYIAINSSQAYFLSAASATKTFKPMAYLQDLAERVQAKNIAQTPYGEYIQGGKTFGLIVPQSEAFGIVSSMMPVPVLPNNGGVLCLRGEITPDKLVADVKFLDSEGKEYNMNEAAWFMDNKSVINKDAISLLGNDEHIVAAVSLKDVKWEELFKASQLPMQNAAQAMLVFLEQLNGTIAIGFGMKGEQTAAEAAPVSADIDLFSDYSFTLVMETKEGEANSLMSLAKVMLVGQNIPCVEEENGISVNLSGFGLMTTIHMGVIDNFLVVSKNPIKRDNNNKFLQDAKMMSTGTAFCLNLDKGDPLLEEFGIKNSVKVAMYNTPGTVGANFELEIEGDVVQEHEDSEISYKATGIIEKFLLILIKLDSLHS